MRCGRSRPRPWPPRGRAVAVWVRQYMTTTEFWDFWKPSPPPLSLFAVYCLSSNLQHFLTPSPFLSGRHIWKTPIQSVGRTLAHFLSHFCEANAKNSAAARLERETAHYRRPYFDIIARPNIAPFYCKGECSTPVGAVIQLKMETSREG